MRRKITELEKLADDLPDLTEQQMRFVEGILSGKNGTDAYKAAYDCSNMQPSTIWAVASRLRNNSKVGAWISAARIAELGSSKITFDRWIQRLDAHVQRCISSGNHGAAVQAENIIGKAMGFLAEKVDVTVTDFREELRAMVAKDPELEAVAQAYADENGITWN